MSAHPRAAAIVAAARACVGTRFRVQGRTPGLGLDCVGVAIAAAAGAGIELADRCDYALSGDRLAMLDDELTRQLDAVDAAAAGDVIVFMPAAGLRHIGVWTGRTLVHAHAGLRRVVEAPPDPGWVLLGAWRFRGG